MSDPAKEIEEIKRRSFDDLKKRRVVMIVYADYGFRIEEWSPDGVAPQSEYDNSHEAAARALQLLGIKEPITPQNWPESVLVSSIDSGKTQ